MFESRRLVISNEDLRARLLPELRERVFHVTTHPALELIVRSEAVMVNPPDHPTVTKWPYDFYFRSVGCLSLCDLRGLNEEKIDEALGAYYFLDPRGGESPPAFLFLSPDRFRTVISYQKAISRGALAKMIVPHIEAGFPGDLKLASIEEVLIVDVVRPPPGPHLQALRKFGGRP